MIIKNVKETNDRIGEFLDQAFAEYALSNNVELNFDEFCFVAEEDGEILGVVTGRAYYNNVHIVDLIVDKKSRGKNIGTKLVKAVEEEYSGKGYKKITLTTFGFQAPEFYKKLGYGLEFVREDEDPRLSKYFFIKRL